MSVLLCFPPGLEHQTFQIIPDIWYLETKQPEVWVLNITILYDKAVICISQMLLQARQMRKRNQDKKKSDASAIPSSTLWRMLVVSSGKGQMKANVLNKVSSSSPSAAWTGLTPAGKAADPEMQHPFHILSIKDGQRTNIFLSSLLPLTASQFTPCLDGKSTVTTCMLMNSRSSCWAHPRHEATVSWCVAVTCGEDAGCFPTHCVV